MASMQPSEFKNPIIRWIDTRLPVFALVQREFGTFPVPKNFNYLWNFGALAMVMMMIMIVTGVLLAMNYIPRADAAFGSVQHIMRDVNYGWLVRYLHQVGSSMFFIVTFVHTFRGIYYGSYKNPRELLWILGVVTLLVMMTTAFLGYVLPWGQMSYWGATVITNMFSAVPYVGDGIVTWLWGGFSVDSPTLTRFYSLHYLLPFVLVGIVLLHIAAIHVTGSNNPTGIEVKTPQDTLPFHPYYTVKDSFGLCIFFVFYSVLVFYAPNFLGDPNNFIPANPLLTPADIQPEWYFLPFYAILRAVPDKLGGVTLMLGSVSLLFVLPWLDTSPVRSARFRPIYRRLFWVWLAAILLLGVVGAHKPEGVWVILGRAATIYYFAHLLIVLPILGKLERPLPLPDSISQAVLGGGPLPAAVAMRRPEEL
jgi:ubiquinol-cytochrome c reductase cytochrome b/c1 subunit